MKFEISKTKKKLLYLLAGIIFNISSVLGSLLLPSSIEKAGYAPFNFLGEFFTINWCVWSSVLTVIYNLNELKNEHQKKVSSVNQKNFGLVVAVSNLVAVLVFTSILFKPNLLPEGRSAFWGTNAIIWHYLTPLIALSYYFKFAKIKKTDFQKRSLLGIILPMPVFFFGANLVRGFLAKPKYLGEKLKKMKFKKFLIPWFKGVEEGKFIPLILLIVFSILSFWFLGWLLLKIKKNYFSKTKVKKLTSQKFQSN